MVTSPSQRYSDTGKAITPIPNGSSDFFHGLSVSWANGSGADLPLYSDMAVGDSRPCEIIEVPRDTPADETIHRSTCTSFER